MKLKSNDRCWCQSGKKLKRCHGDAEALLRPHVEIGHVTPPIPVPAQIARPDYVEGGVVLTSTKPQIQTDSSLKRLRHACQVAAEVLMSTGRAVAPGITTNELDEIAHQTYVELGAYPSTLHYRGYSKSICTSVNGVVCHGIPDDRTLQNGDIVNVDVTAFIDGMHGDNSATFCVGEVNEATRGLVESTRQATLLGISAVGPYQPLQAIAVAIQDFTQSRGYGLIREYGGHGIGATFHAEPHVHHCIVRNDRFVLEPGMTFTVEPMVTTGRPTFSQAEDGWTEHVDDNMVTAQFEHTVMVTEDGVEVLTLTTEGETAVGTLADLSLSLSNGSTTRVR